MSRILVIDDEPSILDVIRTILEWNGYEVVAADDGSRGFASAQKQSPDAIVLDLMMPIMDGFQVLEALRTHAETADVPVVVLTAMQAEGLEDRCHDLGAKGYIQKPFEPDQLLEALEALTPA